MIEMRFAFFPFLIVGTLLIAGFARGSDDETGNVPTSGPLLTSLHAAGGDAIVVPVTIG